MTRAKLGEHVGEDDVPEDEHSGEDAQAIMWPSANTKDVKASGSNTAIEEKPVSKFSKIKQEAEENKGDNNIQNSIVIESKWRDQELLKQ